MKRIIVMLVASVALASAGLADRGAYPSTLVVKNGQGVALWGYDVVAYFTGQEPVRGQSQFKSRYESADFYFASAENKAAFDADPAKYVPAYGGFSGYEVLMDELKEPKVKYWSITDGRLVLEDSKQALAAWNSDPHGNLEKADRNWRSLEERIADGPVISPTGPGADYNPDGPQPGDLAWPGY
jgi:YHS domain-containing protein